MKKIFDVRAAENLYSQGRSFQYIADTLGGVCANTIRSSIKNRRQRFKKEVVVFEGEKYSLDMRGYWRACKRQFGRKGPRRFLHVVAWEHYNQACIRPGFQVHHIDKDKGNNSRENLLLLSAKAHTELHNQEDKDNEPIPF